MKSVNIYLFFSIEFHSEKLFSGKSSLKYGVIKRVVNILKDESFWEIEGRRKKLILKRRVSTKDSEEEAENEDIKDFEAMIHYLCLRP